MKIDFHVHTNFSKCSTIKIDDLKKRCDKKDIIPVITDHNTIKGAELYHQKYGKCIIGEEIKTKDGEITGIFLKKEIPAGLTAEETIKRIKEQNGLVMVPHPFDRLRKSRINNLENIKKQIDLVEIFNSRTLFDNDNKKAKAFADQNNKVHCVGSDAHLIFEVGKSYVILPENTNRKNILKNLANAKMETKKSLIIVHLISKTLKIIKKWKK